MRQRRLSVQPPHASRLKSARPRRSVGCRAQNLCTRRLPGRSCRCGKAPADVCRTLLRRLTEQNSALGRSGLAGIAERKWRTCLRRSPNLERTPNVKTNSGFCVVLYGPVFSLSSERTPRDSPGAAGVYARRLPPLPKTIGRRCLGPAVLAAEPAKIEFCLSKGISEPRPIVGIAAEQVASLPAQSAVVALAVLRRIGP
jgi:hypothetical protein